MALMVGNEEGGEAEFVSSAARRLTVILQYRAARASSVVAGKAKPEEVEAEQERSHCSFMILDARESSSSRW